MQTQVTIKATGETLTFSNGREACEELARRQIITYLPEKYNPDMMLNKPQREGHITVIRGEAQGPQAQGPEPRPQAQGPQEATQEAATPEAQPQPEKPQPQPEKPQVAAPTSNEAAALQAIRDLLGAPSVNIEQVREIVREEVAKQEPRKLEIKINELPPVTLDELTHPAFTTLLRFAALRIDTFLTGPAGTGKTTAARHVAAALNLPFYYTGVAAQTPITEFMGYMNAHGHYVETDFLKAYRDGGVFLIDEIDAINSNTLVKLNGLLDADLGGFPCGMVQKHPDFICIAAGNTIGRGANQTFIGRAALDGASLDRFAMLEWDVNDKLEMSLSAELKMEAEKLRAKAEAKGMKVVISTRIMVKGRKMLANGFTVPETLNYLLFNKLTQVEREALQS